MKYYNYGKYRKPLKCGLGSKQCGGACVDARDICSKDREDKIDKGLLVVKKEISSLEQGKDPGPVFNKTVATLLIEDKALGQKLPIEMANTIAVSKTVDDRVKKSYIASATAEKYNLSVAPKDIVLANEDPKFRSMIINRHIAKDPTSNSSDIHNNGNKSERNFFRTEEGKNVLRLLGATAIVGGTVALATYSLKSKQPEKLAISLEEDMNKSFLKNPVNMEAGEIVNESFRRTGVLSESAIKNNIKQMSDGPFTSQSVYEEYKDIFDGASRIEKERQVYGANRLTLRQREDYKAYWGTEPSNLVATATPDSRLGRAEAKLEARIRDISPGDTPEELAAKVSKAKATMQNKDLLLQARNKNQVYDPETKTWERRTYSNGLDDPNYSRGQDSAVINQQIKNLEKSYLDPDGSTIEMDKFQQDGTFNRNDRNKGLVPIVDIDEIKQRHDDAFDYDNTRALSPQERWTKLNNAGDNKLLSMFIDAEIAKDVSKGAINESGAILFGMKHDRDRGYISVKEKLDEDVWANIEDLRQKKREQLQASINNGHDPFPVKPSYVPSEANISKTDNIKDRFGALGSAPVNASPNFLPERYRDELSNRVVLSQEDDWRALSLNKKDAFIDSQVLKDATRGEVYAKELISGTDSQQKSAMDYITRELEDKYNGDEDIINALREVKRREVEESIKNGRAVLPEYVSQTSPAVTGQDDKDYDRGEKHSDSSDIGTVENVASVNASNGGPKQNKAAQIADSRKAGSFNVFRDTGSNYTKRGFSGESGNDVQIVKDRVGNVFKKRGNDFFINGEMIPLVYRDSNGVTRRRTINDLLEIMYKSFQFSENYSTQDVEINGVIEHKGNVTMFSTINNGVIAVVYDYYNDKFSHVSLG